MTEQTSRYIIGIDLGTTNCALAYVDMAAPEDQREVELLSIPQLIAAGEVANQPMLPSYVYLPEPHEVDSQLLALPWHTKTPPSFAVGAWARDLAASVPGKVVSSAKSWLSVTSADRRSELLPWDRNPVPRQISPVDASRLFLEHLRDAWNHQIAATDPTLRLEEQEVMLTVPASFDAIARELTVEAAQAAGLTVRLLEEPQAAFYAWLHDQGDNWRNAVAANDLILVCDIGGGTTDFSLIAVKDLDGNLELERLAVGDHILLGGDNMDLTLAYSVAAELQQSRNTRLDAYQIAGLTHACRQAKEKLAAGAASDQTFPLTVLGRGSSVIGRTIKTEISGASVAQQLGDGFFPLCDLAAEPAERRKVGLRSYGLDYAADPAVTKHLAAFLRRHMPQGSLPTGILFNGGVTKSGVLRERTVAVLANWKKQAGEGDLLVLVEASPDLAVAIGAAWYGNVKRSGGVRIKSGSARSYYVGIEAAMPAVPGMAPPLDALCVVNFGMEEGSRLPVPAEGIGLVIGEATEFRFFSSTVRPEDQIGDVVAYTSDLEEIPPLVAELPVEGSDRSAIGNLVPVTLYTTLTEVGTLELWCHDQRRDRRWKLEFELRDLHA